MIDTDTAVDPKLDAHLRRTLREVAATVTDRDDRATVVRLVTAPPPSTRGSRWTWLGAAAAAGIVAGAGLMALADRDPDHAAVPPATTVAVDGFGLSNGCVVLHGRADALDDGASAVVFGPTASDPGTVVVSTDDSFFTCGISGTGEAVLTNWSGTGTLLPRPPPDDVRVLQVRAESSRSELVGPGRIVLVGRAGSAVESIDVALPDGSTAHAQLHDGWFLVDPPVARDTPLIGARLTWRTTSGQTTWRRVDLLDDRTVVEDCARELGCVEAEVARLHDAAAATGRLEQAAILDDGAVTNSERVASLTRYADCITAADTGATATVSGPDGVRIGTAGLEDRRAHEYFQDVDVLCRAAHTEFIDDAYDLLDAQRRVAER